MQILRASSYRRMPWKNGGGETFEIAASPPGTLLAMLDWRISMALVATDGPFSLFPGVDRTLSVLDGKGIELDFGPLREKCALSRASLPYHFPADLPVSARLLGGAVTDLNVMSRRGHTRHLVSRLELQGHRQLHTTAQCVAIFCCEAAGLTVSVNNAAAQELQARDCAISPAPQGPLILKATGRAATLLMVEFHEAAAKSV